MTGEIVTYREDLFDCCVDLFVATFTAAPWNEPWQAGAARNHRLWYDVTAWMDHRA